MILESAFITETEAMYLHQTNISYQFQYWIILPILRLPSNKSLPILFMTMGHHNTDGGIKTTLQLIQTGLSHYYQHYMPYAMCRLDFKWQLHKEGYKMAVIYTWCSMFEALHFLMGIPDIRCQRVNNLTLERSPWWLWRWWWTVLLQYLHDNLVLTL
jgi:hypothetical protein